MTDKKPETKKEEPKKEAAVAKDEKKKKEKEKKPKMDAKQRKEEREKKKLQRQQKKLEGKTKVVKKKKPEEDKKKNEIFRHIFSKDKKTKRKEMTRFVKWPRWIILQRQKRVLMRRLKVPPAINQFSKVCNKPLAHRICTFLKKYTPIEKTVKKEERKEKAKDLVEKGKQPEVKSKKEKKEKDPTLYQGCRAVVQAIEKKEASLVVIAHDVEPIETVLFIPALCMKLDIPYCIVKSKARLGTLVHRKKTSCVALKNIRKEDKVEYDQILQSVRGFFNSKYTLELSRKWGGGKLSKKSIDARNARLKGK